MLCVRPRWQTDCPPAASCPQTHFEGPPNVWGRKKPNELAVSSPWLISPQFPAYSLSSLKAMIGGTDDSLVQSAWQSLPRVTVPPLPGHPSQPCHVAVWLRAQLQGPGCPSSNPPLDFSPAMRPQINQCPSPSLSFLLYKWGHNSKYPSAPGGIAEGCLSERIFKCL